jgi:hypothetical protein
VPLPAELLIVVAVLVGAPFAFAFARYWLWRERARVGRAVPGFEGFLRAEVGWSIALVVIGVVLAVIAFLAVMLSPSL